RASSTPRSTSVARSARPAPADRETNMKTKEEAREKRKLSIRKRVAGTSERPRMTVFRSAKHIYVQVVDDVANKTLAAVSTLTEDVKKELDASKLKKKDKAKKVGQAIAKVCIAKGI